ISVAFIASRRSPRLTVVRYATLFRSAMAEAEERGITGKAVTPFLLDRIKEITGGESLEANVELVLNNARLGAAIAVAYARLQRRSEEHTSELQSREKLVCRLLLEKDK